jgi:hypothetical protein
MQKKEQQAVIQGTLLRPTENLDFSVFHLLEGNEGQASRCNERDDVTKLRALTVKDCTMHTRHECSEVSRNNTVLHTKCTRLPKAEIEPILLTKNLSISQDYNTMYGLFGHRF